MALLERNIHFRPFPVCNKQASKRVWESLSAQGHVVITNNGKPTALMIDIADNNPDEVLAAVRQAQQAMRAPSRLQADSLRKGLDGLTEEDIEVENRRRSCFSV